MEKDLFSVRTNCCVCGSKEVVSIISYKMPVFMGCVENDDNSNPALTDMTFQECKSCGNVQIAEEINPKILYQKNHNISLVGGLWKEHYKSFADFISKEITDKRVLEISDPSGKIVKLCNDYSSWTIVEPNPVMSEFTGNEKVNIVTDYFDEDFAVDGKFDVIIHSHFMEHTFDPHSFLKKASSVLVDGGYMIFSVPDLESILNRKNSMINNVLHFEHTYYYDNDVMRFLLNSNGFTIVDSKAYRGHSVFYKCLKSNNISPSALTMTSVDKQLSSYFKDLHIKTKEKIDKINSTFDMTGASVFLFGSHVNSQYLLNNGLKNVSGVIDNAESKKNKKLYGTNYTTYDPNIISASNCPVVVCFHTGPYFEEIVRQLKDLNSQVIVV